MTRDEIVDLIRNEYDPKPSSYRPGDNWEDGAEDIANRIVAEIERLEKLVFVPGMMKCAKCGFVGMHMVLRASDGAVGVKTDVAPEKCPNGCGPLWRVSERDAGNEVCDRLEKSVMRERALDASSKRELLPIETAPKDGTWILGWAEKDSSPYRVSWGRNHNNELAWCTSFASFHDGYITHWALLPEMPK